MAQSKFLMYCASFFILFLPHLNSAIPGSEWCEFAEARTSRLRAESPRHARPAIRITQDQAHEESCCWSVFSILCTIMEYSGSQFPHPIIRQDRRNQ